MAFYGTRRFMAALLAALSLIWMAGGVSAAEPVRVAATVPGLGSLVRAVGGEAVDVAVFARGTEDAHFVEARPSFIKELHQADLYVQVGLGLEAGWAPVLLRNARNADVLPGGSGHLNASSAIQPMDVPAGPVDRSQGDVHALGNPHYLLDPINGLKVARLIRDKLIELRPERRAEFERRYDKFHRQLGEALVGAELAGMYDVEKLVLLQEHGALAAFLEEQGQADLLGGWLGEAAGWRGARIVADHNMWNYFARRFGLEVIGTMEPKPGLPPTTGHLADLVRAMRERGVGLVITSPYFDPGHARFLARHTGAAVAPLAHQVGAVPEADDYLSMFDHNIRALSGAMD